MFGVQLQQRSNTPLDNNQPPPEDDRQNTQTNYVENNITPGKILIPEILECSPRQDNRNAAITPNDNNLMIRDQDIDSRLDSKISGLS